MEVVTKSVEGGGWKDEGRKDTLEMRGENTKTGIFCICVSWNNNFLKLNLEHIADRGQAPTSSSFAKRLSSNKTLRSERVGKRGHR